MKISHWVVLKFCSLPTKIKIHKYKIKKISIEKRSYSKISEHSYIVGNSADVFYKPRSHDKTNKKAQKITNELPSLSI